MSSVFIQILMTHFFDLVTGNSLKRERLLAFVLLLPIEEDCLAEAISLNCCLQ